VSIRLRLALWYGSLTALAILISGFLSYAFHARGHYEDLDRVLVQNAEHAVEEAGAWKGGRLLGSTGDLEVVVRFYDMRGNLLATSADNPNLPSTHPATVLGEGSPPPYGDVIGLVPSLRPVPVPPEGSSFGTISAAQRWRAFVRRVPDAGMLVEVMTPLGRLDSSLATFRSLLWALGAGSVVVMLAAGTAIASSALDPVARMTAAADSIAHSRDLSRRVRAGRYRDELSQLADTLNRMLGSLDEAAQAQQRFVADASHELRAPLTAIQGNLELLRRRPDMPAETRTEALTEAEREASRLARLVADLLILARADAGQGVRHEVVDLDSIVLDAARSVRPLLKGLDLVAEGLEPTQVMGDADKLKQLLVILLDNAIKYTPAGRVSFQLTRDADKATITVTDTGIGIPREDLPHVFERFYRADRGRGRDPGGTGLGLPIARWISEQHGGSISVESEPGQGTNVRVKLPLA
jgi:two-component system OmpR family sensor kinase